ncbi:hypothetical protein [Neptunicoccus cionae]|uniref:Uncharacterized protein n=1 Tax=Neptunicoccus cionae TaxID=2035344 RepID=A0A916R2I0_9RHOB|nr:hypothetical protein [Amylibacter cionae]GGA29644.1 hypothetical protein GCM10011498_33550 [Amylibacter cionae]
MVKQLVIHLGDRKTGSTAIQDALVAGAIQSPDASIFYPTGNNHIPLAKTLSVKALASQRDQRFGKLAKRIHRSDADIAVISAEHFESVDPAALQEALKEFFPDLLGRVRLLAYVRPHGDRLVSNYAEAIKLGHFDGDLDAYHAMRLEKRPLQYTPRFNRWRETFGSSFTLRPFVRGALVNGDIVADFAEFLLGDTPHQLADSPQSNPSMSLEDLAMMRLLQSRIAAVPNSTKFQVSLGKTLGTLLAEAPEQPANHTKLALHADLAEAVQEAYLADAQALDQAFFAPETPMKDALLAARSKAVKAPQSIAAEDHLSPEAIRMVDIWAGLLTSRKAPNGSALREILKDGPRAAKGTGPKGGGAKNQKTTGDQEFNEDDLLDLF